LTKKTDIVLFVTLKDNNDLFSLIFMESKTILIGVLIGFIVGGALVYAVTPRIDPTAYQNQIEELESSLSGLEEQNDDLQVQLSELQAQISSLQTSLAAKDTEITSLGDEVETLTTENTALIEIIHRLQATEGNESILYYDKMKLWDMETGPHLRGAEVHQWHVYPELDGYAFFGSGTVGPEFIQADFDRLASFGANFVYLSHAGIFTVEPPFTLDKDVQRNLDNMLAMIAEADMFAVITFNTGPGRNKYNFVDPFGELSYLLDNSVWESQEAQDAWVEMWRHTAERYRDNPIVVGYELMLEPNSNQNLENEMGEDIHVPEVVHQAIEGSLLDWNQLYPRISDAIREVDTQTPILIGGNGWSAIRWLPYVEPTDDPRTVYAVHQYEPQTLYAEQWPPFEVTYPGVLEYTWNGDTYLFDFDKGWLEDLFSTIDDFVAAYDVPVAVTEFGVTRWVPDGAQFLDDEMSLFEERGMNYDLCMWYPSYEPFNVDEMNYLHGTTPPREGQVPPFHGEDLPNELMDVIMKYWGYNTVRPSDFG